MSLYFKEHRSLYYEHLQRVRENGDWDGWLRFFLEGVLTTAEQAFATAQAILQRFADDRRQIETLGRAAASALRVHEVLQTKPLLTIATAAQLTGLSVPTVITSLLALERLGLVQETTERQRGRLFSYTQYLALLQQETALDEASVRKKRKGK